MKIRFCHSMIATVVIIAGCDRDPTSYSEDSYLLFGQFYGECIGEACVDIFKIENGKVYEDTLDVYPVRDALPHNTSYVPLSKEDYEKVKHISDLIPDELFAQDSVVIGEPDAGDLGGFYLETDMRGEVEYWLIDKVKSNIPEDLHALVDSLDEAIQKLQ